MSQGVHLVTTGFAPRDAISQHVLEAQRVIRAMGLRCEVFAQPELIHPYLRDQAHSGFDWKRVTQPSDVAILHYSISSPVILHVADVAARCALNYHNITPPHFLWRFAPEIAIECARGRRNLALLADRVVATAADSEYNARELEAMGFPTARVVGLLRPPLASPTPRLSLPGGPIDILFVGRGVPNKAQHDLILTIAALHQAGHDARLRLVGSWGGVERYREYCAHIAEITGVERHVTFEGSLTDEQLADAYATADLFLCLSDHEGFCVPLLEAMLAELPIVAYGSSAIPWTLGDGGLVLDEKPPSLVAEAIVETMSSSSLRRRLDNGRQTRLEFHGASAVEERLTAFIEAVA